MNWRNNNLIVNRPIDINKIGNNWQHNPSHRHGVKYNNADVRQKFARTDAQAGKGARQDFRGRSGQQVLDPGRAPPVTGLAQGIVPRRAIGLAQAIVPRRAIALAQVIAARRATVRRSGLAREAASRPPAGRAAHPVPAPGSATRRSPVPTRASCPFACRSGAPAWPAMEEQGASPLAAAGLGSGAVAAASAVAEAVSAAAAAGGPMSR